MIDIIVLVILGICAIYGYCKGLLRMLLTIAASVLTIAVAIVVSPYVNNFIKENTDVYPKMEESIQIQLENYTNQYLESVETTQQGNFIESLGLPKEIESMILENNTAEYYAEQGISSFAQYISKIITNVVVNTAIFVICYIVLFIAIKVVFIVVKVVDYLPFIKEANRLGGTFLCLAEALLVIWVLCLVATPFSELGETLNGIIQQSKVLQFLYQNNPLVLFLR